MSLRLPLPHALRTQLTAWHGLVLTVVIVGFTAAVYGLLAQSLARELDRSLADRAHQVNNAMRPSPPFSPRQRIVIPPPDSFASADTFVQIVTLEGTVVGTSDNLGGETLPVSEDDLRAVRAGAGRFSMAEVPGGSVRLYSAPLVVQGQVVGIIQVARSPALMDRALGQLRMLAGVGLVAAVALSGLVVWLTTGAALRPVENVIATAEAIAASGDLRRRVAAVASSDEAGRLATTFNRMLDRLEASASALQQAYARVEGALEAQRRFAADASHELRTPLTTIRNNAGLLSQFPDVTAEDRADALAQINQEAERMSRLVQDLLTLARADAGQAPPMDTVALAPLVEDLVAQAQRLSGGQHHIAAEIVRPGEVTGNADALRQLLLALLDNAIKYTPAGGAITVRLDATATAALLSVTDTGIGIAEQDLPHIFERFYRADRSRHTDGTGLGLAIARQIIEQHGGTVQVHSTPGQGTTFSIQFPLRHSKAPEHATTTA